MDSEDEFLKPAEPAHSSTPRRSGSDLQRSSIGIVSPSPDSFEDEAGVSESGEAAEPSACTDLKNKCLICATTIEGPHKVHNSISSISVSANINDVYG